jgi:hypothetical protein
MKTTQLKDQIVLAKEKTDTLISDISMEKWFETPDVLKTNLNWQIGHIILANYLHGIASISGANEQFREKVNVPDYIKFYGPKSVPTDFENEKPSAESLLEIYNFTLSLVFSNLENLSDIDLENETAIPNPAAKSKYQALLWLSQHQSWHNGQIAMLKRVLKS